MTEGIKQTTEGRRQKTDDRIGKLGKRDNMESVCKISEDQGIRIHLKVLYNCREFSTNRGILCKTKPIFELLKLT